MSMVGRPLVVTASSFRVCLHGRCCMLQGKLGNVAGAGACETVVRQALSTNHMPAKSEEDL